MALDFRNTNTLWASVLAETLWRLGLQRAIVCPGSRSAPLTVALARHGGIEAIPVLDERSASFFALGLARRSQRPVALVCTSGTAGANFYPAVIEARESRVPLLVLTADRPPELRACNAGQAIDQQKLFGGYPNHYAELAVPSADLGLLKYLRQTMVYAWERCRYPVAGPVHVNLPLREPLAPVPDLGITQMAATFDEAAFFAGLTSMAPAPMAPTPMAPAPMAPTPIAPAPIAQTPITQAPGWVGDNTLAWPVLIVVGPVQPADPEAFCQAIAQLAQQLHCPVLAEGLSPLRNYAHLNPYLVSTYELILRQPAQAQALVPRLVIRFGEMPTSKTLRTWLAAHEPQQWLVDAGDRNLDPLHGLTQFWRCSPEAFVKTFVKAFVQTAGVDPASADPASADPVSADPASTDPAGPTQRNYTQTWLNQDQACRQTLNRQFAALAEPFEGKVAWLLSQHLPPQTPVFISNSMPVRDVEFFWQPNPLQFYPYCNRGANGIDGILSTALGIAHRSQPTVLLTGDLALLHDTNGFLLRSHFQGHLTILLVNNNGGGIFEMLPIAQFDPPFEDYFATPQAIHFPDLCQTYGVAHQTIATWPELTQALNPLPQTGIRVLEIKCDRKTDTQLRRQFLALPEATSPKPVQK